MSLHERKMSKTRRLLNDLFVVIENIIAGASFVTKSVTSDYRQYKIQSLPNQPTVLLLYEHRTKKKLPKRLPQNSSLNSTKLVKNFHEKVLKLETVNEDVLASSCVEINSVIPNESEIEPQPMISFESILRICGDFSDTRKLPNISHHDISVEPFNNSFSRITSNDIDDEITIINDAINIQGDYLNAKCKFDKLTKRETDLSTGLLHNAIVSTKSSLSQVTTEDLHDEIIIINDTTNIQRDLLNVNCKINKFNNQRLEDVQILNKTNFSTRGPESSSKGLESHRKNINIADQSSYVTTKRINDDFISQRFCQYCGEFFMDFESKQQHENKHLGNPSDIRIFCEKEFASHSYELMHTDDDRPYKCKYCEKKFRKCEHKRVHERTHTGEKPYSCKFCDRKFIQISTQISHERTHTGEKPYHCHYCDKKFTQLTHKKLHERRVHTTQRVIK